jgi:hypothetical protein
MIDRADGRVSLVRQCRLIGISRSSLYYGPKAPDASTLDLMRRIDEQYLKTPFYGSRKMTAWLRDRKDDLLRVLDRPEIPLHTNGSENDIRCHVTKNEKSPAVPGPRPAATPVMPSSAS